MAKPVTNVTAPSPFESTGDANNPEPGVPIHDQGITPVDPYPQGTPPDPALEYERINGYPPATLTAINPATAIAGDAADIVLTVTGTGFNAGSRIFFADREEPTTMVSETELTTGVKPSLFVNPDTCPVDVRNIRGGGGTTSLDFTFTAAGAARAAKAPEPEPEQHRNKRDK
jgi:hypothetical protein